MSWRCCHVIDPDRPTRRVDKTVKFIYPNDQTSRPVSLRGDFWESTAPYTLKLRWI